MHLVIDGRLAVSDPVKGDLRGIAAVRALSVATVATDRRFGNEPQFGFSHHQRAEAAQRKAGAALKSKGRSPPTRTKAHHDISNH